MDLSLGSLKTLFLSLVIGSAFAVFAVPAMTINAAPPPTPPTLDKTNVCSGADLDLSGSTKCSAADATALNPLIANIINIFSVIVGVVAVFMIILGGFRYIISDGDSGKIKNARNTILYAIVGLVIVAFAQFIVKFVLAKIS